MKLRNLLALALVAVTLGVGCSSSSNNGGGSGGGTQTVDLAVMDRDYNNDDAYQVMLWLDVLSNSGPGLPAPDLTLDTEERTPVDGLFYNGDLYVAATNNGTASEGGVLIYRDYLNLIDGDVPDAVLNGTVDTDGPEAMQRLAIENNVLVGTTWYESPGTGGIFIWDNATTLTDAAAPDVVLNQATMGLTAGDFDYPDDVTLVDGRLYAAVYNNTVGATQITVAIWNDVQDLIANGAAAPDVGLTDTVNFLSLGQDGKHLTVANDIMYVSGEGSSVIGVNAPYIFVFNNASEVTDASLPDNVLIGCENSSDNACYIESPGQLFVGNSGVLWVANKNEDNSGNDNPAISGFFPANNLFANQPPAIRISDVSGPAQAERVEECGGALFVTGSPDNEDGWYRKGIFIYSNASTFANGTQPTLSAMGSDDDALGLTDPVAFMRFPTGIATTVRGTFDNFVDNGT